MSMSKPVVLCILDGWGLSEATQGNAVAQAHTPHYDRVMRECPTATLITHGPDVGLPSGQMGNSEVGHTNIGAGRVVAMDLGQIDLAIEDGSYARNPALVSFIDRLRETGGAAHLLALVSDGGVHGHMQHLQASLRILSAAGVPVVIHAMTDGRDVAPRSADGFLQALEAGLPARARIGTVIGRYYAMDRDNRWERVARAYAAITHAEGIAAESAVAAVASAYARGENDEFITPSVIGSYGGVKPGDGVFCLNFRADRAREILAALCAPSFTGFDRGKAPDWVAALGMVEYSDAHNAFLSTVFPKRDIRNGLGAWVAQHGLRQFRLAETEKYPHVTFFLNGGKEAAEPGEDRFMPASPKVATYDLQPEMAAPEVGAKLVQAIGGGYDLIVVNFANPDMVGHTGDLAAAARACEAVDIALGSVLEALAQAGGTMHLTADLGNCETMLDPATGGAHTAHTLNPVPIALIGGPVGARLRAGRLADVAPTLLALLGLPQPPEMTGRNLLEA
ncbi:MAG: 2,3-bisphosphoglycerate-independent phosphoglycerate mutase [Roseinatronobacter sp.]|nr:2,3-bisphosphoglycerate-independent phosphoglycerate mutase [Roseinatronobacter sp.]